MVNNPNESIMKLAQEITGNHGIEFFPVWEVAARIDAAADEKYKPLVELVSGQVLAVLVNPQAFNLEQVEINLREVLQHIKGE